MEQKHFQKMNIVWMSVAITVLVATLICSTRIYLHTDFSFTNNEIREELNAERYEIEHENYSKGKYPYLVIDLTGKVLHADSEWNLKSGDYVNVEEMIQQDKSFLKEYKAQGKSSLVLNDEDGVCKGFVIYLLPKTLMEGQVYTTDLWRCFLPLGIGILISCIILIAQTINTNKKILRPLEQISTSAQAIIAGNYDLEVQRVYEEELRANEVGRLTYSFELMRDELKAKQLSEQSLRKAQQELMSCISHDLRTPISTIQAYSEGLRDGVIMDGMKEKDYFEIILQKTNLLEKMISDLLTYSNTQLNKMEIERKEIYFKEYMLEIARELRIFVTQRGVAFSSEIMQEDMIVKMDERRITEVLYNLIENSLKYMQEEGGEIKLVARIEAGVASIHVIDNGIGIGVADIPYVFDKFYRAEKSRSSNIPGSGLGLSICKYIINQHNGEIYCRSRKSQGSEFWFTLGE